MFNFIVYYLLISIFSDCAKTEFVGSCHRLFPDGNRDKFLMFHKRAYVIRRPVYQENNI